MTEQDTRRYYGKYRGVVLNNIDPMQKGRVQVQVPDVLGLSISSWALPCFPFTGRQMGMWALPQVGAGVWVEFEQGNPDYPIWTGGWFGDASEVPAMALLAPTRHTQYRDPEPGPEHHHGVGCARTHGRYFIEKRLRSHDFPSTRWASPSPTDKGPPSCSTAPP